MAFTPPDYQAVKSSILRDIANLLPEAAATEDSDFGVRASGVAAAVEGLHQHIMWVARQIFPDTADPDMMELHAVLHGLARKRATTATGAARFHGAPGSAIPAGAETRTADGTVLLTPEAAAIGEDGTALVAVQAALAGASGNVAAGVVLTLTSAPSGVLSQAEVEVAVTGGTDAEPDVDLLARLLDLLADPPAGGKASDWRRWAMEVPGVTGAFVFPLRRGMGTVDVCVISGDGLPSAEILEAVRQHLDEVRPVTTRSFAVFAPGLDVVDVTAHVRLSGVTLAQAQAQAETDLAAYFDTLDPGDTVYLSRIETVISSLEGVVDRVVTSPADNVEVDPIRWARLGSVVLEAM